MSLRTKGVFSLLLVPEVRESKDVNLSDGFYDKFRFRVSL